MCWTPGARVELEVLVHLRLALSFGRLVDGKLDAALAVGDHLGHERGILGGDLLVGEMEHLGEAEHALVVRHPLVHAAQLDVAHRMVELGQEPQVSAAGDGGEAREKRPVVGGALDEGVHRLAVRGDRREAGRAVLVLELVRLGDAKRAALERGSVGSGGVGHGEGERTDAVAVGGDMLGDRARAHERCRENEAHIPVPHDAGGAVAQARSRARPRRPP